jgi:hypothetical protein
MTFRSKRTFRLCSGQLERLKPCNIARWASAGWRRPWISASDRGTNCCSDFFFISATYIIKFSIYLFSKFSFSFRVILCFGARGNVAGWGTMLQAGRSRVWVPMRWIFFNWPNPSSRTMSQGSTQPLTEMSTRNLPGGKRRPVHKADKMWQPRRLTTLWASTVCYRDSY